MSFNSLPRFNHTSSGFKQLPLQPLSKNHQETNFSQRSYRDKATQKVTKQNDQLSSKSKPIKQQKAKENVPDSRTTSISIISKIPDEKEESVFIPSQDIKGNKPDIRTEKSFQDLNKSLANLALRRCIGRSSSDNEAVSHISHTETDLHQRSYGYGLSNRYMETQPADGLTSKTPFVNKKSFRGHQTSVQKGMEITPFSFVNQINRETANGQSLQGKRDNSSKDLTLSDLEYGRFQSNTSGKSARPTQNTHYLPIDTRVRALGKNYVTEGSYRMEFSHIDHLDNTDTQMYSHYFSNDMQLSYLNGDFCQEIGTENLKDIEDENKLEAVHQMNIKNEHSSQKSYQKKNPKLAHFSSQQNFRSTPSFKKIVKGKDQRTHASHRHMECNPRRYSDLASIPRVTIGNMDRSLRGTREQSDKLELNHLSDDVEYIVGGVGLNHRSKKLNVRNKSSFLVSETNDTFPKQEGIDSVRRETLDVWKQDIMKIKKEMEARKKSYAEVNKFVKMYEKGTTVSRVIKDSRDSSFDLHATRKTSNISSVNVSKFEKMETIKPYSAGFKALTSQETVKSLKRQNRKKPSFELRTMEDYDDQRSAVLLPVEQTSALSKSRVKTTPYYDFNNDTNEANNSFVYEELILDRTQRLACCGSEKMCNMF